jgi:hypothetical protein
VSVGTFTTAKAGDKFEQVLVRRDGKRLTRVIELISPPRLSSPAGYRILRNDAHPHRVGKFGSLRRSELERKYRPA